MTIRKDLHFLTENLHRNSFNEFAKFLRVNNSTEGEEDNLKLKQDELKKKLKDGFQRRVIVTEGKKRKKPERNKLFPLIGRDMQNAVNIAEILTKHSS